MPELVVVSPGEPEKRIPLERGPILIGRAETCDVWISEKKASRRHLRVSALGGGGVPGGGWVAEDLASANGTWLAGQRVLRRLLCEGDELRIGDTTIAFRGEEPAVQPAAVADGDEAPVVTSSMLDLRPVSGTGSAPASFTRPGEAEPAPEPIEVGGESSGGLSARVGVRAGSTAGTGRAVLFCIVAIGALVGVEVFLGDRAKQRASESAGQREMLSLLADIEELTHEQFERAVADFEQAHPSTGVGKFDSYLAYTRERDAHKQFVFDELERLVDWTDKLSPSDIRAGLQALLYKLPHDERFAARVQHELQKLNHARVLRDEEAIGRIAARATVAMDGGDPAHALRLLTAFRARNPGLTAATLDKLKTLETRANQEVERIFETGWKAAEAAEDREAARMLLAGIWPRLAGTDYSARVANRLRDVTSPDVAHRDPSRPQPSPDAGQPAEPEVPPENGVTEAVLAQAAQGEELILARQWSFGRELLSEAVSKAKAGGRLHGEWTERIVDVDRILLLTRALAERAGGEKPVRKKLSIGRVTVKTADALGVTLVTKDEEEKNIKWPNVPDEDVLALLKPVRPSEAERLGVALLAADLGDRDGFITALAPIYEKGKELAAADRVVARRLYGRPDVPEGGYRLYKGDLLDRTGYERRLDRELVDKWRGRAAELIDHVSKLPSFKKLAKLQSLRVELDKRREYTLLAIFNEKHYPYPANKGSEPYRSVQQEIDRRIEAVKEIWDDPYKVKLSRTGQLERRLDEWDELIKNLQGKGVDVTSLVKQMAPYTTYVTGEPITIRDYFKNASEMRLQAYNRWVMQKYNPARTEFATAAERKQVEVTNEYRMLMGYMATVTPSDAPYEAIDKDSVVSILDAGRIIRTQPLRAVRVDNRLTESARAHSKDMGLRGYFSHTGQPNPETGEGPTTPFDRMAKAGYQGWGASENIANGSTSPQGAHMMWRRSSGHHRNILSGWSDLGSGQSGRLWTQNFGTGGGARPVIQPDTDIHEPQTGRPRGKPRER